ncbi:MAG TPA: hypothetical protein VK533_02030 [Sphingomonas sp.]|uniref:hypothetical protein n=1 Tax=Sphingomonas sp. TaxID=28214 RepID=UPI002C0D6843|nr:hypothetical protein [Sphingomonas sp.]HMI18303.1 hypothetical protein [Sphingomonas sp.]
MLLYLLAVVMDEPPALPAAQADAPPHIYLHPPTDGCDSRSADEVVVCGSKDLDARYRLKPVENDKGFEDKPLLAAMKLGKGALSLHGANGVDGTTAAMITFKIPF